MSVTIASPTNADRKPRLALFIATACGLGYIPVAPGTWGSLAGVVFWGVTAFYLPIALARTSEPFLLPVAWLARNGYGTIDLLKLIDTRERGTRFARRGLITEPGMLKDEPSEAETKAAYGVRYFRPDPARHVEFTTPGAGPPNPYVYGWPTGVVGLRLFPNPEFDAAAKRRWDPDRRRVNA